MGVCMQCHNGPDVPLTSTICSVAEHKRSSGNYHLAWVILQSHFWGATYSFTVASCWCVQLSSCVVHSHCYYLVKCWLHGVCFMCLSPLRSLCRHAHFRPCRHLAVIYYKGLEPLSIEKRMLTGFLNLKKKTVALLCLGGFWSWFGLIYPLREKIHCK